MHGGSDARSRAEALCFARALLVRWGWTAHAIPEGVPFPGREQPPLTLLEALWSAPVTLGRWDARRLLCHLADDLNLERWNAAPARTGAEAVALIDKALRVLGFPPPTERYHEPREPRRGGWSISCSPALVHRCPYCGAGFRMRADLELHVRAIHEFPRDGTADRRGSRPRASESKGSASGACCSASKDPRP